MLKSILFGFSTTFLSESYFTHVTLSFFLLMNRFNANITGTVVMKSSFKKLKLIFLFFTRFFIFLHNYCTFLVFKFFMILIKLLLLSKLESQWGHKYDLFSSWTALSKCLWRLCFRENSFLHIGHFKHKNDSTDSICQGLLSFIIHANL